MAGNNYQPIFEQAGQANNVDPMLMMAIQQTESGGDPTATSSAGAEGNMQIMPQTAAFLGVQDPYNPEQAIPGATRLMAQNLAQFKDPRLAVAAYFGGPDTSKWGPKTSNYVATVAKNYAALKAQAMPASAPAQSSGDDLVDAFISPPKSGSPAKPSTPATPAASQPADDLVNAFLTAPTAAVAPVSPGAVAPISPGDTPMIGRGAAGRTPNQIEAAQAPVTDALGRIASAVGQGASAAAAPSPVVLTPQAIRALDNVGVPADAINMVAGLPIRAAGALFGGAQAGIAQTGAELGAPDLGREVASIPEAFAGDSGLVREMPVDESRVPNAPNAMLGKPDPNAPIVPNAPNAIMANAVPQVAASASTGKAVPRSVGAAATPGEATVMTPREAAANDAAALQQQLTRGPIKGDSAIYVPGSVPTEAEVKGDADTALEQKFYAESVSPELFRQQQQRNNDARVDLLQQTAGNPINIQTAEDARDQNFDAEVSASFANKGQADAMPVSDLIDQIMAGPAGKNKTVVSTLKEVQASLHQNNDPQAPLETDPEMLYGVRKAINQMISKTGAITHPQAQAAIPQLMEVKNALDQAIEPAAQGFGQAIQNYADASRPIDAMTYLQNQLPSVIKKDGTISPDRFHNTMVQIAKARALPGANAAKSIDPQSLENLMNIHSDLVRMGNLSAGKATGSDTFQKASFAAKIAGKGAHLAAHAIMGSHLPLIGNLAVESGKDLLAKRAAQKTAAQQAKRVNELLNPYLNGEGQ